MASREKLLIRKRRYRERHLEAERERNRIWRSANLEYLREQNRIWRANHPEAGTDGVTRWRIKNPDLHAAAARAGACNRRAKAASIAGHISRTDVTALWERQPSCQMCGKGRGVDHIIALRDGGPNTPDNLQNLCQSCNNRKSAALTKEQVQAIRAALLAGIAGIELSRRFNVSKGTISLIKLGRIWKDA